MNENGESEEGLSFASLSVLDAEKCSRGRGGGGGGGEGAAGRRLSLLKKIEGDQLDT